MIHDLLTHLPLYRPVQRNLAVAIDWITATDLSAMPVDGVRKPIDGDNLAVIVSSYTTLLPEAYIWESHRRYVDIQILLRGEEHIGVTPITDALTITTPYDDAKDAQFYAKNTQPTVSLHMRPGAFAVFFPQDVHGPNQAIGGKPMPVTKAVLKVRV